MAESTAKLKLLIDTHGQRVLFAEAGKDCVDLLFQLLCLPVATVIKLRRIGSLANIYESIENLNEKYIQPEQSKDTLLNPIRARASTLSALFDALTQKNFYRCKCASHVRDDPRVVCPNCGRKMTQAMPYVAPPQASNEGGFVKGAVTYMVMDDLEVTPLSTMSIVTLLNKFNVNVKELKEECEFWSA